MKTAVGLVMLLALVGACYAGCLELNTENFEDSVASGVTFVKLYVYFSRPLSVQFFLEATLTGGQLRPVVRTLQAPRPRVGRVR